MKHIILTVCLISLFFIGCIKNGTMPIVFNSCPGQKITCQAKRTYTENKVLKPADNESICFDYEEEIIISNISNKSVKIAIPKQRFEIFHLDNTQKQICDLPTSLIIKPIEIKPGQTKSFKSKGKMISKDRNLDMGIRFIVQEDDVFEIFTVKIQNQ